MKVLSFLLIIAALCSCNTYKSLTLEQQLEKVRLEHEINRLYNEYNFVSDSLITEYNNIGK